MAYSRFTLEKAKQQFQLTINQNTTLFSDISEVSLSDWLQEMLSQSISLATYINTEKARSELIVAPILLELKQISNGKISFFSGVRFDVDKKQGLNGQCDYLISQSDNQFELHAPIVSIVEAKSENIKGGFGQCVATMIASRIFNKRENEPLETIYGIVTTGTNWKFLKLVGNVVYIDKDEYHVNSVEKIIGILIGIIS
ncbi:MAG: hypothetical protein B6242_12090 [Anaerolineaceae bacterium 4572_78]|nr:MAG: hypothetical protein B6242_12090 [Anaerolineaceae bacterium 4572_78]